MYPASGILRSPRYRNLPSYLPSIRFLVLVDLGSLNHHGNCRFALCHFPALLVIDLRARSHSPPDRTSHDAAGFTSLLPHCHGPGLQPPLPLQNPTASPHADAAHAPRALREVPWHMPLVAPRDIPGHPHPPPAARTTHRPCDSQTRRTCTGSCEAHAGSTGRRGLAGRDWGIRRGAGGCWLRDCLVPQAAQGSTPFDLAWHSSACSVVRCLLKDQRCRFVKSLDGRTPCET